MKRNKVENLIWVIFFVCGLVFTIIGIIICINVFNYNDKIETTGKITEIGGYRNSNGNIEQEVYVEYTVDGTPYKWTAGEDLSEQFLIAQNGGNVTFAALTFDEYLGYIYPNAKCSHDMAGKPFYSVNITSGKRTVALNVIAIKETIPAEGIEIVPDEVITG